MGKALLQVASTLTNRYQTTIPEPVRRLLHLNKRDKITYNLEDNGKVLISRATEDDPILSEFLKFLAHTIKNNPLHIQTFNQSLIDRANNLISDMEVDLNAPLNAKDE